MLVVVVFVVIVCVLALFTDFREVMLTSPPELAHSAPPLSLIWNGPFSVREQYEALKQSLFILEETPSPQVMDTGQNSALYSTSVSIL